MENNINLYKRTFLFLLFTVLFFLPWNSIVFSAEQPWPSSIIKLPENENVILVEKKSQTLFLYTSKDRNLFVKFQTDF